jgi:hypothetical protein
MQNARWLDARVEGIKPHLAGAGDKDKPAANRL